MNNWISILRLGQCCLIVWGMLFATIGCGPVDKRDSVAELSKPKSATTTTDSTIPLQAEESVPLQNGSSSQTDSQKPAAEPMPDQISAEPWLDMKAVQLPLEYWEAQYLNAQHIGVTHYKIDRNGQDRFKVEMETTMQVMRAGQMAQQSVSVVTIEQPNGRLDSFFETLSSGGAITKTEGSVIDKKLMLKISSRNPTGVQAASPVGGKQVPWPDTSWGPLGLHQLLMRKPMRIGEARMAEVFLPQMHQMARVTLVAGGAKEDITAPDGMLKNMVPIEALMQLENEGIRVRMWCDDKGSIQKTIWPEGLNLSSFRISRDMALRLQSQGAVELNLAATVELPEPITGAQQASRIEYQIDGTNPDPHLLFSNETNQSVQSKSAYVAYATVFRPVVEGNALPGVQQTEPTPEHMAASTYVTSEDNHIISVAKQIVGDATQPLEKALKLTAGVHAHVQVQKLNSEFDNAKNVAIKRTGDCTEHAVLLAALLRSQKIPARLASGIKLADEPESKLFMFHMWTEAWVGDRWIPLDATLGTLAGCGHIKFLETSLSGTNPYDSMLPVLKTLSSLKITVADAVKTPTNVP